MDGPFKADRRLEIYPAQAPGRAALSFSLIFEFTGKLIELAFGRIFRVSVNMILSVYGFAPKRIYRAGDGLWLRGEACAAGKR